MANQKKSPPRGIGKDPYLSYRFKVKLGEKTVIGVNEVSGLSAETDVESFREGGVNTHEQQLIGPTKYPSKLTLKRGLADSEFWDWYVKVMSGRIERQNVAILLQDYSGKKAVWKWILNKACPVKWSGPDFRAGTAEIAFESIELIHQGLAPFNASGPDGK